MDLTLGPSEKCRRGVYVGTCIFPVLVRFYAYCAAHGGIVMHNRGWATAPSAGRARFAVAFVFGPGGQDCGGVMVGKLL